MSKIFFSLFMILPLSFFLSSCERSSAPRTYTEVTVESVEKTPVASETSDPHAGMKMDPNAMMTDMGNSDPHAGFTKEQLTQMLQETLPQNTAAVESPILWTVPDGWQEKPASGMRIATFVSKDAPSDIDCSIVTLGGGAGGLAPNVVRWLGQLNIAVLPEAELQNFIEKQERINLDQGFTATLFNFTTLQKNAGETTPSMLAAIIDTPQQRIFVKMTGTKQKVLAQTKNFKALVASLKFKE